MKDLNAMALNAIFKVSQSFSQDASPREVLTEILGILDQLLQYHHGMISLLDPETGDLLVETALGIDRKRLDETRYRKGEGIVGLILKTKKPLSIKVIKNDPRFVHRLDVYNPEAAFLGVPILIQEMMLGVFTITLDPTEKYRLDEHQKILTLIANLTGSLIIKLMKVEQEKEAIVQEKHSLQSKLKSKFRPSNMVGISKVMQDVFDSVRQVARWNTTVLIRGESGTGKELVTKAIHYESMRSNGPFIKLNCAALPDNLLESELFGHEKGAFTGAIRQRPGRFELANGGTLFLDEIGDTSLSFQSKLLRVLQESQFERLGGDDVITVDVRIITATNVELELAVAEGRFREDLFYRLNVMPIYLPPLRERREDIPLLVDYFLEILSKECEHSLSTDEEFMRIVSQCELPGNVRELENCVHRAAVTSNDFILRGADLPCTKGRCFNHLLTRKRVPVEAIKDIEDLSKIENERERVIAALELSGWVQAKAARLLNQTPRQIGYRIKKLGIEMKSY